MNICSAKNCYLLTKKLYAKSKTTSFFMNLPCDNCKEMTYCCEECKNLDWFINFLLFSYIYVDISHN